MMVARLQVDEEILKERKRKSEMALRERLMSDIRSQRVKLRRIMVGLQFFRMFGKAR